MKVRLLLAAASFLVVAAQSRIAPAALILNDDFESYANTAAMNAVWNEPPTGAGTLDTLNGFPSGMSLNHPGGITQKRTFTPTVATDASPLIWEFDLFDDNAAPNKRNTGGLRDNGGGAPLSAILEMGRFNSVFHPETGATVDAYAIRTVFLGGPADANGWLTLYNPSTNSFQPRSAGWHHFKATIGATNIFWQLDINEDGFYDASRTTLLSSGANKAYNVARFGGPSDIASAGGAIKFDNLLIRQPSLITQPWSVTVADGPHNGATGSGSFTYNDGELDANGNGVLNPSNGLSLSTTLFGQTLNETNDSRYSGYPQLTVQNFTPVNMDYYVTENDSFNPTAINEPGVATIVAQNPLTPSGGGGYEQQIHVIDHNIVTKPWSVTVVGGPHDGETGSGSFTYDESWLDTNGNGTLGPSNSLSLSLTLFGQTFHETNDVNYDSNPQLSVQNYAPTFMNYVVSKDNSFNPTPINQPGVHAIIAQNLLTAAGGGGYHQEIQLITLTPAQPPELITNGGFEEGSGGWTATDLPDSFGGWYTSVPGGPTPLNGFPTAPNPNGGNSYAVTDQFGPGTHVLRQSFTVPVGAISVKIAFDMFVNDADGGPIVNPAGLDHNALPNQHARVDILTASADPFSTAPADIIANLYLGVDPQANNPNPYTSYLFDLTGLLAPGETYQLRFAQVDNQFFLNQGVDNVSVIALVPEPTTNLLLAMAIGSMAVMSGHGRNRNSPSRALS